MRALTTQQRGYVSGETYSRIDRPGENLVISTWQSVQDWQKWRQSEERAVIQKEIDTLLGKKTEFQVYTYF
jgi:heme-degrading monooxygenase HmoA